MKGKSLNQPAIRRYSAASYIDIHMARMKIHATLDDLDKLSKKDVEEIIEYPTFLESPTIRLVSNKIFWI